MRLFLSDMVKLAGGVAGLVRHSVGSAAGRGPRGFASSFEPSPPPPFETFRSDFFRPSGPSGGPSDRPGHTSPEGPGQARGTPGDPGGGPARADDLQDIRCALQSILSRLEALETQARATTAPDPSPEPKNLQENAQGNPRRGDPRRGDA